MPAMLCHDGEALLPERFQAAGVHEGRQGREDFNVAARAGIQSRRLSPLGFTHGIAMLFYLHSSLCSQYTFLSGTCADLRIVQSTSAF